MVFHATKPLFIDELSRVYADDFLLVVMD